MINKTNITKIKKRHLRKPHYLQQQFYTLIESNVTCNVN